MMNKLLTREETCEILHIGVCTYYKLCHQSSFPLVRVGRKFFVDADGLELWIKEQYKM